jgi:hypothetical protein
MTTNETLAATLDQLGVYFVSGDSKDQMEEILSPDELLCGLASNSEARMRLALIPLFLKNAQYVVYVSESLNRLAPDQQNILRCYYTAAQLLQEKYSSHLNTLFGSSPPLPDLFEEVLGLDKTKSADERLKELARQQARLSGKSLNWYGTYEHAYDRLIKHTKKRTQWQL